MNASSPAKNRLGSLLFLWDARRRLRKQFSFCRVQGLPALASRLERGPVIVAMNHVAFWDGFLLPCLEARLGADAYCLMDRDNLQRLSFLRFAGAVPVDLRDRAQCQEDLERAALLLDRPGRLLFVFPQGTQVPPQLPLRFKSGVLRIAELSGASIVPAGLSYEFMEDPKPEVRLSLGSALERGTGTAGGRRALERAVRQELDAIDASLGLAQAELDRQFVPLLPSAPRGLPAGSSWLGRLASGGRS